jgi:hypothetical protein
MAVGMHAASSVLNAITWSWAGGFLTTAPSLWVASQLPAMTDDVLLRTSAPSGSNSMLPSNGLEDQTIHSCWDTGILACTLWSIVNGVEVILHTFLTLGTGHNDWNSSWFYSVSAGKSWGSILNQDTYTSSHISAVFSTEINSVAWVHEWTIPTERQALVGEVSDKFCGKRVPGSQRDGSLRPYSRLSWPEPLLFLSSSSSIVIRWWYEQLNIVIKATPVTAHVV